jgi:hypothetical protein
VEAPTVGARPELARYTFWSGERIFYGQRIDGITDRLASHDRVYLVERGVETKQEPEAFVADDLKVERNLHPAPPARFRSTDTLTCWPSR